MKLLSYIFLFILITSIYSCSDDTCDEETESLLNLVFTVNDTSLTAINFVDSLSVYSPEWADSILFSEEGSDTTLSFVLSPNSDTSEIIITSKKAPLKDTLIIVAQRELIFLSKECGFITEFLIDTVVHSYNYIDSIDIKNYEISNNKDGQIEIYF